MQTSKCEICKENDALTSPPTSYLLTCHQCFRSWHSTCCIPPIHDEIMADLLAKIDDLGVNNWQCKECGDIQLRRFRYGGPDITYVYWNRARKVAPEGTWKTITRNRHRKSPIKSESLDGCLPPKADDIIESDDDSNSAMPLCSRAGQKKSLTARKLRSFMMDNLPNKSWSCQNRVMKRDIKFWNGKTREVRAGAEVRRKPVKTVDLCGRYHWVYVRHETFELETGNPNSGTEEPIATSRWKRLRDHLELWLRPGAQGQEICGELHFKNVTFNFEGMTPKRDTSNIWEPREVDVRGKGVVKDATFTALEVADDSGNPFLQVEWDGEGYDGIVGGTHSSLVGKKEVIGQAWKPLSEREREDLGIEIDERVTRAVGLLLDDQITKHCFASAQETDGYEPMDIETDAPQMKCIF